MSTSKELMGKVHAFFSNPKAPFWMLLLVAVFYMAVQSIKYRFLGGDAYPYMYEYTDASRISDQYSVLLMHELSWGCRIYEQLFGFVLNQWKSGPRMFTLGVTPSALCLYGSLCLLTMVVFFAAAGFIIVRVCKGTRSRVVCCVPFVLVMLLCSFEFLGLQTDVIFCTLVLILTALLLTCLYTSKSKQNILLIAALVVFFHLMAIRPNAILLAPFAPCLMLMVRRVPLLNARSVSLALFGSIMLFLSVWGVNHALPHRKFYPTKVMMLSDLQMVNILKGSSDDYVNSMIPIGVPRKGKLVQLFFLRNNISPRESKDIIARYLKTWRSDPGPMMFSKMLSIVEFYWGADPPQMVKSLTHYLFPQLQENPSPWYQHIDRDESGGCRIPLMLIFLGELGALLYWLIGRHRSGKSYSDTEKLLVTLSLMLITYNLSYWIVTPTATFRYHFPTIVVLSVTLPLLFLQSRTRPECCVEQLPMK
ncbi:MAG: hypothetical protein ACI4OS_07345 [Akkermansia sp.]